MSRDDETVASRDDEDDLDDDDATVVHGTVYDSSAADYGTAGSDYGTDSGCRPTTAPPAPTRS